MIHHAIYHFLQTHCVLGYLAVFLAMMIEGDLFLFTAAFLTHQGFFDPVLMFVTIVCGTLSGDLLWFWGGLRLRQQRGWVEHWTKKMAEPFDEHLQMRTFRTIFLSKFIYGLHHAILVRAGMLRMKLGKFIQIDFASTLIWVLIVGGLGFVSSLSFDRVRHQIKFFEGTLLVVFVGFVAISYLISYTAKKKL